MRKHLNKIAASLLSLMLISGLIVIGLPSIALAAVVRQNSNAAALAAGTSNMLSIGGTAQVGDTLIVIVAIRNASATCVVSASGASFTQLFLTPASTGAQELCMAYAINIGTATTTVLITSGTSAAKTYTVIDYSGVASVGQTDGGGSDAPASSQTQTGHSLVTTNANDVIVDAVAGFGSTALTTYASAGPTAVGGTAGTWSNVSNIDNGAGSGSSLGEAVGEQIVSSTGTYQATWTSNPTANAYMDGGLALKATATPSTVPTRVVLKQGKMVLRQGKLLIK
jgi:hypothetical protein